MAASAMVKNATAADERVMDEVTVMATGPREWS
jgi:hypothetical protein